MLPQNYTLTIHQGATLWRWWRLEYSDGTVPDLTALGYTIGRLQVRDEYASNGGEVLLELTTDNGGVVIDTALTDGDGVSWDGYLYASPATTAALEPFGEAVFDFEISNGTDVRRVMQGVCVLDPETTA